MAGEIKSILERSLRDIEESSLKSFRSKLNDYKLEGFENIPLDKITEKTAEELVDVIWRHYTAKRAPGIIVQLLNDIEEKQASLELKEKLDAVNAMTSIEIPSGNVWASGSPPKVRINPVSPRIVSHQASVEEHHLLSPSTDSLQNPTIEDLPVIQGQETATKSSKVKKSPLKRGKPLPDITLNPLTEDVIKIIREDHNDKPHVYARLLIRFFVPYEIFMSWSAKKVNFDGQGGKRAMPQNLIIAIMKAVRIEFGPLKPKDKKDIKTKMNNLLRNPPKTGWPLIF